MVLVSKVLEGDNYNTRSRAMRISLSAKDKIGFVTGSIKPSSLTDDSFPSWQQCNDMVISWLLNVIYAEKLQQKYGQIYKNVFFQGNDSRIYQIKRDIVEHRQGQQSISRVMQFLMGLNGSYVAIRGQILLMQPLPDTYQVYSLVLQQEKQVEVSLSHGNKNLYAMLADQDNKATSAHQVQKQKTPLHCSYCDHDYHNIEKCYYLHGFPIGHKLHVKNVKPPNQCHSNANNMKVETNKAVEIETKFLPTSDGLRLTTEEYNQLMAMIRKNNGDNSQHFANATGINMPSSKIILDCLHLNIHYYEEDDWLGQAT
ncbi:hypothetical protein AAG906_035742 [Vitis piasezkii]